MNSINKEQTHTPTPWHLNIDPQYIQDQHANIVAVIHAQLDGKRNAEIELEGKANAAFIVRAVNSHEALLKIARAYVQLAEIHGEDHTNASLTIAQAEGE